MSDMWTEYQKSNDMLVDHVKSCYICIDMDITDDIWRIRTECVQGMTYVEEIRDIEKLLGIVE
jgi:hypothetical protein